MAGLYKALKEGGGALTDLAMDTVSRMKRAKDMGFDTSKTYYHGTTGDFDAFDLGEFGKTDRGFHGKGVYLSEDPAYAGAYSDSLFGGGNVVPAHIKTENTFMRPSQSTHGDNWREATRDAYAEMGVSPSDSPEVITEALQRGGYDSLAIPKVNDAGEVYDFERVVFDPSSIRSVNAAFDPAKKGSSDLLAGIGTLGAGTTAGLFAALQSEDAEAGGFTRGMKKLYRGLESRYDPSHNLNSTDAPAGYSTWTDSPELARQYAGKNGEVYEIDLPESELGSDLVDIDGERPLFVNNQKAAGLNGVSGNEFLLYQDHDNFSPSMIKASKTLAPAAVGLGVLMGGEDAGAGTIGTGVAALYTPKQNQAYADQLAKMGIYEHTDTIKPEASPGLYSIGAALDRIETPLDPLMGRGWATSGISKYLKDFGERKGGSLESLYDSAGAVMDVM